MNMMREVRSLITLHRSGGRKAGRTTARSRDELKIFERQTSWQWMDVQNSWEEVLRVKQVFGPREFWDVLKVSLCTAPVYDCFDCPGMEWAPCEGLVRVHLRKLDMGDLVEIKKRCDSRPAHVVHLAFTHG